MTTMNLRTTLLGLAGTGVALALAAGPAAAAGSVVKVTLWDKGADSVADIGHGMAMDGSTAGKPGRTSMGISATPAGVEAGGGGLWGTTHPPDPRPRKN